MNECEKMREYMTRGGGEADDARRAEAARHLASCVSCARYSRAMSSLCDSLRSLAREADAVAPPARLHERVASALQAATGSFRPRLAWTAAAVAAGLVVAARLYLLFLTGQPQGVGRTATQTGIARLEDVPSDALPTFAVYRKASAMRPDDLERLMDRFETFCPRAELLELPV